VYYRIPRPVRVEGDLIVHAHLQLKKHGPSPLFSLKLGNLRPPSGQSGTLVSLFYAFKTKNPHRISLRSKRFRRAFRRCEAFFPFLYVALALIFVPRTGGKTFGNACFAGQHRILGHFSGFLRLRKTRVILPAWAIDKNRYQKTDR